MPMLKLQVQMTLDGFVARPDGAQDWMNWDSDNPDEGLKSRAIDLADSVDTIILGRKVADDFIPYWSEMVKNPDSPEFDLAKRMVDIPKVVFTHTLKKSEWDNTTLATRNIVEEVNRLKKQDGKGLLVYGGAGFVSSLLQHDLIDEYHLFINPAAIGEGMAIFNKVDQTLNLKLVKTTTFDGGVVELHYEK